MIIPCPSPITLISLISLIMSFLSDDNSDSSKGSTALEDAWYCHLLGAISALHDEVLKACILQHIPVPMMRASQLPLLEHFANFRPHLFCKKLRVNPEVFDCILDQISSHPIFLSRRNQPQLPVAIQLVIFLNCAATMAMPYLPKMWPSGLESVWVL